MCTTQHLLLIPLFAPLLRATSTESSRGECWLFASVSLGTSDVITVLKLKQTSAFTNNKLHSFHHNSSVSLKLSILAAGPSSCEEERRAATQAHSVYIPSCELGGAFSSRQCQQGGQCWCVDHTGQELPGTRQQGLLDCSECPKPGAGIVFVISTKSVVCPHCSSGAPLIQQIWVLIAVLLCATVHSSTCFLVLLLHLSRPPSLTEVKPPVPPLFRPSGVFCQWR